MAIKNKPNYYLRDTDGVEYPLYVVSDFEIPTRQSIIINESATGNGGVSYSNGRLQETIPVNGTLIGDDIDDVNSKKERLRKLSDSGEVVEFNTPYVSTIRSNKFFIQEIRFGIQQGQSNSLTFSMSLTEYREANVKTVNVNLVNFETAELMKTLYEQRIGGST